VRNWPTFARRWAIGRNETRYQRGVRADNPEDVQGQPQHGSGYYFIEDLHTAYLERFGGGYRAASSTIECLKGLMDAINRGREAEAFLAGVAEVYFSKGLVAVVHQ
jgi:hypothetical protein